MPAAHGQRPDSGVDRMGRHDAQHVAAGPDLAQHLARGAILEADHAHPAAGLVDRRPAGRTAGDHPAGRRDLDIGHRPGRMRDQGQRHLVCRSRTGWPKDSGGRGWRDVRARFRRRSHDRRGGGGRGRGGATSRCSRSRRQAIARQLAAPKRREPWLAGTLRVCPIVGGPFKSTILSADSEIGPPERVRGSDDLQQVQAS